MDAIFAKAVTELDEMQTASVLSRILRQDALQICTPERIQAIWQAIEVKIAAAETSPSR